MEASYHLRDLLHLLCLSFAVGVAYIALERFRYSKKIGKIFDEGIANVQKEFAKLNYNTDSVISNLKKLRETPYKYGSSFFFEAKNRKGKDTLWGTDQFFVFGSLVVLFFLICFCTVKTDYSSLYLFYLIFTFPILAILFTLYLILSGNGSIKNAQNNCETALDAIITHCKKPDDKVCISVGTLKQAVLRKSTEKS
ncbi:MAG: hypothetical protein A3J73_06025 [Planctomycetes bacterium RIFCSPHIGHO2_02_FULL_38_41]|nr:MAG: hypothetical protein A3J73_06025 [Planctomycetes bacterium RIFCSPHIGHO2_02_FULL_38_41]OHB96882.1 MAG: hypothetical protein A2W74_04910 [Planctomycetes bacterium RIFCSPLOWO2_12_38_17]